MRSNVLQKMKYLPLSLGVCITCFWMLAFATALFTPLYVDDRNLPWWNFECFRAPGMWLGDRIFQSLEGFPGLKIGTTSKIVGVLFLVSFGMGSSSFLVTQIAFSRFRIWSHQRRVSEEGRIGSP